MKIITAAFTATEDRRAGNGFKNCKKQPDSSGRGMGRGPKERAKRKRVHGHGQHVGEGCHWRWKRV